MFYNIKCNKSACPCPTLEKVTKEELQAIAARVEALGIPCSVA